MTDFLITIKIAAESLGEADDIACAMSEDVQGNVVTVCEDRIVGFGQSDEFDSVAAGDPVMLSDLSLDAMLKDGETDNSGQLVCYTDTYVD